jgi:hypothetical protein
VRSEKSFLPFIIHHSSFLPSPADTVDIGRFHRIIRPLARMAILCRAHGREKKQESYSCGIRYTRWHGCIHQHLAAGARTPSANKFHVAEFVRAGFP